MEMGESEAVNAEGGHSVNLMKFNKNTAFTRYSRDSSAPPRGLGAARAKPMTKASRIAGFLTTCWAIGFECHLRQVSFRYPLLMIPTKGPGSPPSS